MTWYMMWRDKCPTDNLHQDKSEKTVENAVNSRRFAWLSRSSCSLFFNLKKSGGKWHSQQRWSHFQGVSAARKAARNFEYKILQYMVRKVQGWMARFFCSSKFWQAVNIDIEKRLTVMLTRASVARAPVRITFGRSVWNETVARRPRGTARPIGLSK